MSTLPFHPVIARWFTDKFGSPTDPQVRGWPAIQSGAHTLIAAPTGSGKTLAAFLCALDALFREGLDHPLPDETRVVYVSPLKALSNDIHKNLDEPLAGIREALRQETGREVNVRAAVRTGDTPAARRQAIAKVPPHVIVTTPESFYLLLTSASGRKLLKTVRTLIVDEIHAVVAGRRGAHLALSMERLRGLVDGPLQRIGLSATQKPIEEVARYLVGNGSPEAASPPTCTIVDTGHARAMDVAVELPDAPLEAVMSNDVWDEVYSRLAELLAGHRTTLIFVNTRRLAERVAHRLAERLGPDKVASHHGSLSAALRLEAEDRLKRGQLSALVATASLELGIDIGSVDLVCQLGTTRSIATFLQRIGRAGHWRGGLPKGRLFPLTRDELVECAATLRCVRRGQLDALHIPAKPLDVLAQQIVAAVATDEWSEPELFETLRAAYPYRDLTREEFDAIVRMLAEGFSTRRGRRGALLHHDAVHQRLRARRGARLVALTSGGAIPDNADYRVVLEPAETFIGTVNEDFAVESMAGDIFQLGNNSWRILRVNSGVVRVEDAHGQPPGMPFWLGEGPARTAELSEAVAELRDDVARRLEALQEPPSAGALSVPLSGRERVVPTRAQAKSEPGEVEQSTVHGPNSRASLQIPTLLEPPLRGLLPRGGGEGGSASEAEPDEESSPKFMAPIRGQQQVETSPEPTQALTTPRSVADWLVAETGLTPRAAQQLADYLAATRRVLGVIPSQQRLVLERFFDESGGMQLVIHSPFGARLNRAWGLALRKRFCRSFNFELQAAATDDAIVLSLGTQHSFPLDEVFRYLHSNSVRDVLVQALLDAPMFGIRWRWNATRALALPRFRGGRKVAAPLQRMESENLLAAIFPDQLACLENIAGDREVPDHPLVQQTIHDCLTEAMDIEGLESLLRRIEAGEIECLARDLPEPSPLAHEILNARPYAFLDDAPLEERRTQAAYTRRASDPGGRDFTAGILDPAAIQRVCDDAWPRAVNADELHDALLLLGLMTDADASRSTDGAAAYLAELAASGRAGRLTVGPPCWVAAERWPMVQTVYPAAITDPVLHAPQRQQERTWERSEAVRELVRGRLEAVGPISAADLAHLLALPMREVEQALLALEAEGFVLRGNFRPGAPALEWCDRRLLARIHRLTLNRLRAEIEPVSVADFQRFLLSWQRVDASHRAEGPTGVEAVVAQLEGCALPAAAWEPEVLSLRIRDYQPQWLDLLCASGRVGWGRLMPPSHPKPRAAGPVRSTPISIFSRAHLPQWLALTATSAQEEMASETQLVRETLTQSGAMFFSELVRAVRLLPSQVEEALAELVALGWATADSFEGLRALLVPAEKRSPFADAGRPRRHKAVTSVEFAGRWTLLRLGSPPAAIDSEISETARAAAIEFHAKALLRRYGVMFRRLLEREGLPVSWFDLIRAYRRLEARGEIRGGHFVAGISGEQFALPEAVGLMRSVRRTKPSGERLVISGADPLNLAGLLVPGRRIPAICANRLLLQDGVPLAALVGDAIVPLDQTLSGNSNSAVEQELRVGAMPATLRPYYA